jgi:nitrogen regulatory protein P-II 1
MFKRIDAIIREEALDPVKDALREVGIVGMHVAEVAGHGRSGGAELSWRGTIYKMDMVPKIKLSIVLSERNVSKTVDTITKAARTGAEGDGIIFISPIEEVIRIRTGERGGEALSYPGDIDQKKAN